MQPSYNGDNDHLYYQISMYGIYLNKFELNIVTPLKGI